MIDGGPNLDKVIGTLNTRSRTLEEMADAALFYYQEKITYDEKAAKKFLKPSILAPLKLLVEKLDAFSQGDIEGVFSKVMESAEIKLGKVAQPARVALTGKTISPGIFEIIEVLGKERTLSRLKAATGFIAEREDRK